MTPKFRVLVWDDEPLIHTTIRLLFATTEDLYYVGEVIDAQWLVQQWNETASHILLISFFVQ